MAKLTGIVKFTGKVDGYSYFLSGGKIIMRKTGGFDGKKIKSASNYVRVRENSKEFAESALAGKYVRTSIAPYMAALKIPYVHNRIVSLFQSLVKLDTESARGSRKVVKGLLHEEAASIIMGFEFDKEQSFGNVFPFRYSMDWEHGRFSILDFDLKGIKRPKAATHVLLQFRVSGLDFETFDDFKIGTSEGVTFAFREAHEAGPLHLSCVVPDAPTLFGFLFVRFLQEVNGEDYVLTSCALKIVGIR